MERPSTKIEVDLKDGELPKGVEPERSLQDVRDFVRRLMGVDNWSGNVQITLTQAKRERGDE